MCFLIALQNGIDVNPLHCKEVCDMTDFCLGLSFDKLFDSRARVLPSSPAQLISVYKLVVSKAPFNYYLWHFANRNHMATMRARWRCKQLNKMLITSNEQLTQFHPRPNGCVLFDQHPVDTLTMFIVQSYANRFNQHRKLLCDHDLHLSRYELTEHRFNRCGTVLTEVLFIGCYANECLCLEAMRKFKFVHGNHRDATDFYPIACHRASDELKVAP